DPSLPLMGSGSLIGGDFGDGICDLRTTLATLTPRGGRALLVFRVRSRTVRTATVSPWIGSPARRVRRAAPEGGDLAGVGCGLGESSVQGDFQRFRRGAAACLAAFGLTAGLVAAPALAASPTDPRPALGSQSDAAPTAGPEGVDYRVELRGELPAPLRALLEEVSQLEEMRDRPPATRAALRRRVQDERGRYEAALKSAGYYAFALSSDVDTAQSPALVTVTVEPGPQFTLGAYTITYRPQVPRSANDRDIPQSAEDLDLELGMPAQAAPLQAAEARIVTLLTQAGYPYAEIAEARYLADHARSQLTAGLTVATGPRVTFGSLTVEGAAEVEEDYIRAIADWPDGEVWDARALNAVRNRVAASDLFETVVLDYPEQAPPSDGAVPVTLVLRERPHRSIGVGAAITSSEEIARAKLSWEHRNLFGAGETLRLEALGSLLRQEARALFRRPNFLRGDQALLAKSSFRHEESDAFDETTAAASLGVERSIGQAWTVNLDTAIEFSEQRDSFGTDRFTLVGLPAAVAYDTRDNLLDPTRGWHVTLGAAPWVSVGERSSQFLIGETSAATYWSPFESDRVVFAGRARLGALFFEDSAAVPASKRFYAGGGGSVRGYDFRVIGPLDADGDPLGGKSVVEVGLETRIKVSEDIGVVPFLDGGQVYENTLPDADFDWQWAAGLGLRYYLGIGPVRLDVAVPLNPRDEDDRFEFYLSIGQAF
ncbi:tamA, partial [Symbiodinium necroappetens]